MPAGVGERDEQERPSGLEADQIILAVGMAGERDHLPFPHPPEQAGRQQLVAKRRAPDREGVAATPERDGRSAASGNYVSVLAVICWNLSGSKTAPSQT